jgi:hypothetical protein
MARDEHLAFLMQGAGAWNKWRAENPNLQPDLSGSDLRRVDLIDAVLRRVNFAGADLRGQNFVDCNLQGVNLNSANLARADLSCACVTDSDLSDARCRKVCFESANLGWSTFSNTDFDGAEFAYTSFCNVDLSTARLQRAKHLGPSTVGTDTVVRTALGIQFGSEAQETVERFFRDCGLDDQDIENFQRHVKSSPRYRSAFICYARKDQEFVETLYARLKSAGVRCWIDVEQRVIGAMLEGHLREAVRDHDRVILCCSEWALLHSKWVKRELRHAFKRERETGAFVILPLDLDGYVGRRRSDIAKEISERDCIDFTGWRDSGAFEAGLATLMSALVWTNPSV